MYTKKQITLAIVTKNRPEKLSRLLDSLVKQRVKPIQIIIVDNDLNLSAKKIVSSYQHHLPIKYLVQEKQGVPFARNTALDTVTTQYLAFTDDDCILSKCWIKNAEKIINKFNGFSYFIGGSDVLNPSNNVALAQHVNQRYWFLQKLHKKVLTTPFNVDTKNIIFKVSDLKENKLNFDTDISIGWFDSADTDLGFAMKKKGLQGIYVQKLKLWHEETTSLRYFLKKGFYRGKLSKMLAKKWDIEGEFVYLPFLNWVNYLKSTKGWKDEYIKYFSVSKRRSVISFLFLKLYERFFLGGYIS